MSSKVLQLTKNLIRCQSVTPDDKNCQKLIADRLHQRGFLATHLRFCDVYNLWLKRGDKKPLIVFAGHTDVVPPGPIHEWTSDPFEPTEKNGELTGRGAADMKSSIAAFVIAVEDFLESNINPEGSIALLLTSDEEGPAINGTVKVVEWLQAKGEVLDFCVVGAPTSSDKLGDTIKNGRRGSISGELTVFGLQGHVAYPHLAQNPIHLMAPIITDLTNIHWDQGNEFFPPTTFQISNLNAGTGATNVIPGNAKLSFNLRFSPVISTEKIKDIIEKILLNHGVKYQLNWKVNGQPFLTNPGNYVGIVKQSIADVTGTQAELSTTGGTSDARFISTICDQVIELGPINKTIHQVNEKINITDLEKLVKIYKGILCGLLNG